MEKETATKTRSEVQAAEESPVTKPSLWERYLAIEAELDIPIVDEFLEDEYDSEDGADFPAPC
jgi:hypothetical protein